MTLVMDDPLFIAVQALSKDDRNELLFRLVGMANAEDFIKTLSNYKPTSIRDAFVTCINQIDQKYSRKV